MIRIIYPEKRVVSDEKMCVWYSDAVANGQVEDIGPVSAYKAALHLHRAGLITLSDATRVAEDYAKLTRSFGV